MSRNEWIGTAAAIVLAVLLVLYARPLSEAIVGMFFEKTPTAAPLSVGRLTAVSGQVIGHRAGEVEFKKVAVDTPLLHHDQIKVERESRAQLELTSGWKIALNENSEVAIELYRPDSAQSPVLLSFVRGDYVVVTNGQPGMLYVMQNKKVFSPTAPPPKVLRSASILAPNTPVPQPAKTVTAPSAEPSAGASTPLPSAKIPGPLPDKLLNNGDETLSSVYIEKTLSEQAESLRKCQLNSVRDNKRSEGNMLLSLTISPNGRIDHIKVLQDQVKNEQLASCAVSVLERMQFKTFSGLPITLTYPIEFR
jgi:hypothetical protein